MIIDERMSAFIDSLDSGNPAWLNEIEKLQSRRASWKSGLLSAFLRY